jgi:NADH-quinone oxidoreductase subunit C
MRDDEKNVESQEEATGGAHEALKFHFTPVDPPRPDTDGNANPHAKRTTSVPDVVKALREKFGDAIGEKSTYANEDTVLVERSRIVEICRYLKQEHGFNYLSDLGGTDRFVEGKRYEVFYNIVAIDARKRIRLKIHVHEDDLTAPSITDVYKSANWNEREVYDMLGIRFEGHNDMRRMYMPEDFDYYPLRKEFPQLGVPGSLPLPPQTPEGDLTMDPFAAAHGSKPVKSYEEPRTRDEE